MEELISDQKEFRAFFDNELSLFADEYDKLEQIPEILFNKIADKGLYRFFTGTDMITCGVLCEEIGRASASLLSILTVHGMLSQAILKWGSSSQRKFWLKKLSTGEIKGAFGLSEPAIGSDAKNIQTQAVFLDNSFVLSGTKKWISFGQRADLFLIIAQLNNMPTAFLLEKDTPGLFIKPIKNMLGFRAAMLAELQLDQCRIPEQNIVGKPGFGMSHIANTSLDFGRYSIACGSVGIAQACLETSLQYSSERQQFGTILKNHQLVKKMIADMATNVKAARLLCYYAGELKKKGDPESIMATAMAKYFSSRIALKAATDAVQIHGANGCSDEYPVQRYYRDAKISEIIEGSNQIQQILISRYAYTHPDSNHLY